jgi:hypothetical protein
VGKFAPCLDHLAGVAVGLWKIRTPSTGKVPSVESLKSDLSCLGGMGVIWPARETDVGDVCEGTCTVPYLVDPASSHMLVSKIKPCMSKFRPRLR